MDIERKEYKRGPDGRFVKGTAGGGRRRKPAAFEAPDNAVTKLRILRDLSQGGLTERLTDLEIGLLEAQRRGACFDLDHVLAESAKLAVAIHLTATRLLAAELDGQ